MLASVSILPFGVAAAPQDKVDGSVRHLATANPGGSVPVLIARRSASGGLGTLKAHGATIRRQLEMGNMVAASVPNAELDAIAADPDVLRIAYDAPMQTQSASAPDPLTLDSQLRSAYPMAVQATQAWTSSPRLIGTGVGIAVLDSGLDKTNADMDGSAYGTSRVTYQNSMIQQSSGGSTDDYGHGTWVSGIAAGRGWGWGTNPTEGLYVGIAPDANLIELKIADINGQAYTSDVINAIEWASNNQALYNIRVINLSLVSSYAESYTTSALDAAVEMAWLKGIVVVVSAGNGGPNTMLYAPANDPFVITVGATDDKGTSSTSDDSLTSWSSYGTTQDGFVKPNLVAPGRHIVGPLAGGNVTLASQFPNNVIPNLHNLYIQLSGTSAAGCDRRRGGPAPGPAKPAARRRQGLAGADGAPDRRRRHWCGLPANHVRRELQRCDQSRQCGARTEQLGGTGWLSHASVGDQLLAGQLEQCFLEQRVLEQRVLEQRQLEQRQLEQRIWAVVSRISFADGCPQL